MAQRLSARELITEVVDDGSFISWDTAPVTPAAGISESYAADLAEARRKSGEDEAVLTGEGLLDGRRVALVVCEFKFLAGSIGVAAAERLVTAIERATAEGLPLLAGPASGGTRMQEGTLAFLSMVKITTAVKAHRAAGLPFLVYLRHPTTGGVFASWGSLGHFTAAEPGALIGFLGPRVYEELYGEKFPENVQKAENLFRKGLVDAVLSPDRLGAYASRALDVLLASQEVPAPVAEPDTAPDPGAPAASAWDVITASRNPERPGVRDLLRMAADNVLPLNGTGQGEKDRGLLLALAKFGDAPCIVLGQDRYRQNSRSPMGPAALREARRGMAIAEELKVPLVTVIDTPGAALSQSAEEGGLAGEIARSLGDLVTLKAPTVSVILGEGSGGGALALIPADRVITAQNGWLSPLPPEGASAIVHRDTAHAAEMAEAQQVQADRLLANGIVDRIVAERPDAAAEPREFVQRIAQTLEYELIELMRINPARRFFQRVERYRGLGL
ncbi:acetyl-CoA carboxylase carboxyltransferase subunit alpha/beta [Brevibacterium sp. 50QC2O2]|jgi:acetyl-CoA carboxylase carboxyl transferase beta subunit|uniref:acetyl-CoA carboxylase carboxyltransferase subunit alpha/beta n=1 Tax=Brevibacterium TaxID=1696 RepID=UPI00211CF444|nr:MULTISPECIES: acetyl-CoA carboxylase carboxyltransferase subunit alpha/beta [unclassified Brevibacterium]MCQ9366867.1 acetyl-CoA carboxylase carboxyltransferase subunit alpha/beta [Brevibacterium sp. 91QC2O2]MCQ9384017.1 acetyl-CoA carboxylase carboxyltransferase subunit alpha/beta [Brevibacterium sp. 68QC2CO]MCQ9389129.1 acetyl-CoA carboxylase carboxyltransferase subunit alpha/beta [Brevibacterium sp. 50QC2O2]